MKRTVAAFIAAVLVLTAGCLGDTPGTTGSEDDQELVCENGFVGVGNGTVHVVNITADGFTPERITITQGDSVRFVNQDTAEHWPATDRHPSHTQYPGSSIGHCGSEEEQCSFDACTPLQHGESYTYTFNASGSWGYHDHRHPSLGGIIIVQ